MTTGSLSASGTTPRVGGVDAFDVGEDLTALRAEGGGERDRGRVGAAAAERGDLLAGRDALETGDEHDLPFVERLVDPLGSHLDDLRLRVRRVGDDSRLRARERDRLVPEVLDRHLAERAGDALADRDQHVHGPRFRPPGDAVGQLDELVGRVAHRREDGDHATAFLLHRDDPAGDRLEPVRVADRGTAELHHHRADALLVGRRDPGNGLVVGGGGHCAQA